MNRRKGVFFTFLVGAAIVIGLMVVLASMTGFKNDVKENNNTSIEAMPNMDIVSMSNNTDQVLPLPLYCNKLVVGKDLFPQRDSTTAYILYYVLSTSDKGEIQKGYLRVNSHFYFTFIEGNYLYCSK